MSKLLTMEQFKETINAVQLGNYDLHLSETKLIIESSSDFVNIAYNAYKYGFLKGTRSVRKNG